MTSLPSLRSKVVKRLPKYKVIAKFNDLELGRARDVGETMDPDDERAERLLAAKVIRALREGEGDNTDGELVHLGGGFYQLPNGEKVRGKDKALEALAQLKAGE